jgi:hypothetical protein
MELDLLNKIQLGRVTRLIELTKENIKKGKEDKYMMDIETIVALNKEQGRKSKRNAIKPVRFEEEDIEQAKEGSVTPLQKIVNLGDHVPKGWKRFNTKTIADKLNLPFSWKILDNGGLFVDSSGLGSDNEPALSVKQFLQMISKLYDFKKDLGFAICSEGQFQLTVGVYEESK